MRCPNCQHWNEVGAHFCEECEFEFARAVETEAQVELLDDNDLRMTELALQPPTVPVPQAGKANPLPLLLTGARLTLISTGSIFKLGEVTNIGRQNPAVQIDFEGYPDGKYVSGQHARIMKMQNRYYIEDLGSANNTYVNDIKLASGQMEPLEEGDRVRIGKIELIFHESGEKPT